MTLEIPDALEEDLRRVAAARGLQPAEVSLAAINAAISESSAALPSTEPELLSEISRGFPAEWWGRYKELIRLRQTESINASDLEELVGRTDELEELAVRRTECLGALARLRQTNVESLMQELDLKPEPLG